MIRWMSGVTKLDRSRNDRIRRTTKVDKYPKSAGKYKLKWSGHVLNRQASDGDGGAGEKKERKTEAEVVG